MTKPPWTLLSALCPMLSAFCPSSLLSAFHFNFLVGYCILNPRNILFATATDL